MRKVRYEEVQKEGKEEEITVFRAGIKDISALFLAGS